MRVVATNRSTPRLRCCSQAVHSRCSVSGLFLATGTVVPPTSWARAPFPACGDRGCCNLSRKVGELANPSQAEGNLQHASGAYLFGSKATSVDVGTPRFAAGSLRSHARAVTLFSVGAETFAPEANRRERGHRMQFFLRHYLTLYRNEKKKK